MFNMMLEKEFAGNVLTVGYVGQMSNYLPRVVANINTNVPPLEPGGCGQTTTISFPSPCQPYYAQIPMVNGIQLLQQEAMSNYHALQIVFQRRLKAGLTVTSNYTWSKSLSDTAGSGGGCGGCNQVVNNFARDYGPNDYQASQRFTLTANYQLPSTSLKGFLGQVVNGWQINDIISYGTGQPFTVLQSPARQNSIGITSDRPDALPQGTSKKNLDQWFDTTAFRAQTFGKAGNEGRNPITMPSNFRTDLSVFKDFKVTESVKLQFRAEMFNFTNTPSFGLPGSTISSYDSSGVPTQAGNFGRITSMNRIYTPRDIQFALRLMFAR